MDQDREEAKGTFSFSDSRKDEAFLTMEDDSVCLLPWLTDVPTNTFQLRMRINTSLYYKTIKAWFFRVLSDLSVLACGLVTKNRALGLRPRALFLVT